jgi:hypothetical protein
MGIAGSSLQQTAVLALHTVCCRHFARRIAAGSTLHRAELLWWRWLQFAAASLPDVQPFTRMRLLRVFNVAGMFPFLASYRIIVKALCEGA